MVPDTQNVHLWEIQNVMLYTIRVRGVYQEISILRF